MPSDDLVIKIYDPIEVLLQPPAPNENVIVVPTPGPPGPTGPAAVGDKTFRFIQDTPSMHATIMHGLNKYPAVTIVDTGSNQVEASITYVDINSVTVDFSALSAWTAFFN